MLKYISLYNVFMLKCRQNLALQNEEYACDFPYPQLTITHRNRERIINCFWYKSTYRSCFTMFDPLAHVPHSTCFVSTCFHMDSAKHAWSFDHRIDFDNSSVIDKGSFRVRKTLEAWHTFATKHAGNNS